MDEIKCSFKQLNSNAIQSIYKSHQKCSSQKSLKNQNQNKTNSNKSVSIKQKLQKIPFFMFGYTYIYRYFIFKNNRAVI